REAYEFRIFPRRHNAYFEDEKQEVLVEIADVLRRLLRNVRARLGDPDYNFYIHSAPVKHKNHHSHYHWHIEVLPKISIAAGFELGTGIEITVVDPNEAAQLLKIKS
ncbi:MAG: galactose-1-phosphate uridylyltransferase, partial [Patescibacteria group bacterium]